MTVADLIELLGRYDPTSAVYIFCREYGLDPLALTDLAMDAVLESPTDMPRLVQWAIEDDGDWYDDGPGNVSQALVIEG